VVTIIGKQVESMAVNYVKMTADTMAKLPEQKQAEVYDFANFLRLNSTDIAVRKSFKKASILKLVGIGASGKNDIALNHDKYLYE
jgi:hypothetical protein